MSAVDFLHKNPSCRKFMKPSGSRLDTMFTFVTEHFMMEEVAKLELNPDQVYF